MATTITEKLHDAAAIQRRAKWFRTLLLHDNSSVLKSPATSSADMTDLVTLWNQSLGSVNSGQAGYMAKVAAAGPFTAAPSWQSYEKTAGTVWLCHEPAFLLWNMR